MESTHEAGKCPGEAASRAALTWRFSRDLLYQAAGAIAWAAWLVVVPIELLVLTAIAWIPLLIWRENKRSKKYGPVPGAVVRIAVMVVAVVVASKMPREYDRYLDNTRVTFDKLEMPVSDVIAICKTHPVAYHTNWWGVDEADQKKRIKLPSQSLTLRELARELQTQAGLNYRHFACGNGTTIISGVPLGQVGFHSRRKTD